MPDTPFALRSVAPDYTARETPAATLDAARIEAEELKIDGHTEIAIYLVDATRLCAPRNATMREIARALIRQRKRADAARVGMLREAVAA